MSTSITTLCLNPALDVSYHVNKLIPEQKSRATSARHDPGGNGLNIGRALKRMQVPSHTFCVIAGAVGQILKSMLQDQLDNVYYQEVSGETRINTTVVELDGHTQYQITDSGTDIPLPEQDKIIDAFVSMTDAGYGIITGSCQPNVPKDLYARLVERIQAQGGKAVIDSHGDVLRLAIEAKPFLIKPNKYELETLLDVQLSTVEAVAHTARQLQRGGVENVCVSLGAAGALLVCKDNSYYANALNVPVNTTVGAGDSMVAGLVAGFSLSDDPKDALRYGIACGAGTVMHPGTQLFSGDEIADFRKRVRIESLDI